MAGSRYSYDGEIFNVPESSLRPRPLSQKLSSRFFGASSTNTSLELMTYLVSDDVQWAIWLYTV